MAYPLKFLATFSTFMPLMGFSQSSVDITIGTTKAIGAIAPEFLSFGWEMEQFLGNYLNQMADPRYILISSHMSPALVRIGGISGDFITYDVPNKMRPAPTPAPSTWSWPGAAQNYSTDQFRTTLQFLNASGLQLMFDLNELLGRECTNAGPAQLNADNTGTWCLGDWDTSNVRDFLQYIHDEGLYGPGSPLVALSAGNELRGHLDPVANAQDIIALAGIVKSIWSDVPSANVPPVFGTDTDDCYDNETRAIITNLTGYVRGFTYHAYPGGSGSPGPRSESLQELLLNSTWLRTGIMAGSSSEQCIGWWNTGPRASGMQLLVTESSSSWNATLPPPAQNSFLNGFFSIAEWGQYSSTGVSLLARWAFSENSPFATIFNNGSRWDVAADYFLMRVHKQVMGAGVLLAQGDAGSAALVYAHCGTAGNGSIVVMAVNPSIDPVQLALTGDGDAAIPTTPRFEFVFTAPGGDLAATTSVLNGDESAPLRIGTDGSLPPMPGLWVPVGGATVLTLPPRSQAFFVLLGAGAPACV